MSKSAVYVAESPIHGRGLFARRRIKAGEVIGKVKGSRTRRDGPHVLWLNEKEGVHVKCDLRFINHSDRPNACYYDTLEVVALCTIHKHEEITHDYNNGE
jgi:SET domain-containing protein